MITCWAVCGALLGTAAVSASEQSQAFASRGLIELDDGRTQAALELFDRAVAADPGDAEARYLRGSTRAKLGDYTGAIEDLQAALAARPDFPQAALELGAALTETGRYAEAAPWLQRAQQRPKLDAQASFFLGLAQLRLDRLAEAQANFARARAGDPSLDLAAQYYEGVIAYRRRDLDVAEERFSAVERANPDSAMGREAVQFRELIRRSQRAAYSAYGAVALEYDSNVTLGPTDEQGTGISGEADGRVALNAGGRYVPWRRGPASLSIGYEFFQSLQFRLSNFDLQDHRPAAELQIDLDRISFGLLGRYDYYLLETDSFLQEATAFPWVRLREEGIGHTDLYARIQWRDYKQRTFDVLSGFYNFAGVRQVIDLGARGRQLWFGYQLGFTSTDDQPGCVPVVEDDKVTFCPDQFEYASNQIEVALRWPLPYMISTEVGYRYERQDYNQPSSVFKPAGDDRADNDHRVLVSFQRPLAELSEHLFVVASWFGTWNDSNKDLFNYTRQIGSVGAEVRF